VGHETGAGTLRRKEGAPGGLLGKMVVHAQAVVDVGSTYMTCEPGLAILRVSRCSPG
jgi:hypothetical protein